MPSNHRAVASHGGKHGEARVDHLLRRGQVLGMPPYEVALPPRSYAGADCFASEDTK